MPVFDTSIQTKFVDGSTDLGGKGWVLKDYIIDVYPNLAPSVKTPALWLWGLNSSGQLGDNTATSRSSPVQTVTSGTNWSRVACAGTHTAAIKTDGTLWLWGSNTNGQLGDNTTISKSSPVQTTAGGTNWKQVACAGNSTAAIKTDGTLWLWGSNSYGQLGNNNATSRSSPVQTVTRGTNWSQVSVGAATLGTCTAAVKTDGTLWLWGSNNYGQLGNNTTNSFGRSSPVQTVSGGTNWSRVACAGTCTAAIKTDGTLWLWGQGSDGKLGDNTAVSKSSPVQTTAGGTNWKRVSVGGCAAAIKTDGTLWLWGQGSNGFYGLHGDNTATSRSSPVQTVTRGTNWNQVSCGDSHTAAIKTDGSLWLWGNRSNGRLGDNSASFAVSSPVQTVTRGTNWKQVSCGGSHTAVIADGNY